MKPLLTTVDAVLFDLDGTLVETNIDFPLMKREMIALAVEQGLDPEPLSGMDILAIVESAADCAAVRGDDTGAAALRCRAMDILEEIEVGHARGTTEIPFARDIIHELRSRDIGIGIVTRNCRRASEMSLEITGISVDVLICREDARRHKPHPEQLHKALEKLHARADASIMVGDHLMDVLSGQAAGMKTIGFLREDRPPDFFDTVRPDAVVRNLQEALDAIIHRDMPRRRRTPPTLTRSRPIRWTRPRASSRPSSRSGSGSR
jgi:phosphoglycolate phosphatase